MPALVRLLHAPLTVRRAAWAIGAATIVVTVASGIAIRLVDRSEFPNVWLGIWWAVQTVTTVGYGDVVPTKPAGRILATVVMATGIGFLTVVTASITAAFVENARRRLAHEEDTQAARLEEIAERLERLERALHEKL